MPCEQTTPNMELLNGVSNWKISLDLMISLHFPVYIIQIDKRPYIDMWSDSKKSVRIEYPILWEKNREEEHKHKKKI